MPKPEPLSTAEAQHLVDYVLERLTADLAEYPNSSPVGRHVQPFVVNIAMQRLIGAIAGEAAELRVQAVLGQPCQHFFGDSARAIAQARALAAADVAAQQVPA